MKHYKEEREHESDFEGVKDAAAEQEKDGAQRPRSARRSRARRLHTLARWVGVGDVRAGGRDLGGAPAAALRAGAWLAVGRGAISSFRDEEEERQGERAGEGRRGRGDVRDAVCVLIVALDACGLGLE
jgi:hypothetical protein